MSPHRRNVLLPPEILEQIISYLSAEEIDMQFAQICISWYLATLTVAMDHLRRAIRGTEALMCVLDGETVVLSSTLGDYPPGTEVRWVPVKRIENQSREIMRWHNSLCRIVGFKQ
jgi:hypothetical protein